MEQKKSLAELLIDESLQLDKSGSKESATYKILMEQRRFNQDCRKRALDCAQMEQNQWVIRNDGKLVTDGAKPDILELADKYYAWLTKEV